MWVGIPLFCVCVGIFVVGNRYMFCLMRTFVSTIIKLVNWFTGLASGFIMCSSDGLPIQFIPIMSLVPSLAMDSTHSRRLLKAESVESLYNKIFYGNQERESKKRHLN